MMLIHFIFVRAYCIVIVVYYVAVAVYVSDERLFLHSSQIQSHERSKGPHLQVGMEVEYNVAQEQPGKWSAIRCKVLPRGTVSHDAISEQTYIGTVVKDVRKATLFHARDAHRKRNVDDKIRGDIKITGIADTTAAVAASTRFAKPTKAKPHKEVATPAVAADSTASTSTPLTPAEEAAILPTGTVGDIMHYVDSDCAGTLLCTGDIVEFKVACNKRTKVRSAVQIKLKQMAAESREKGVVSMLKEDGKSGKIMSLTRAPLLIFNTSALLDPSAKLSLNDCVEFNVSSALPSDISSTADDSRLNSRDKKKVALRISLLPAGSVVAEHTDPTVRTGIVLRAPVRGGRTGKSLPGVVLVDAIEGETAPATAAATPATATTNAASIHPATFTLVSSSNSSSSASTSSTAHVQASHYDSTLHHPSCIAERPKVFLNKKGTKVEMKKEKEQKEQKESKKESDDLEDDEDDSDSSRLKFSYSDVIHKSQLQKDDRITFLISTRSAPMNTRRAVQITLVPFRASVLSLTPEGGLLKIMNKSGEVASKEQEQVTYFNRDVLTENVTLGIGDIVQFGKDIH